MSVTSEDISSPPADLPTDSAEFWGSVPADLVTIPDGPSNEVPVIDQLGAAPFKKEKGGFPFLGFLASVYEHVSATAKAELNVVEAPPSTAEEVEAADETEPTDGEAQLQVFATDPSRHTDPIEERP